jgi:hypothetical protein
MAPLPAKRSAGAGAVRQSFPTPQPSLNDLDDDTLLCVLRLLPRHHRAIMWLAYQHMNAQVEPVAGQRLPLEPLRDIQPLPWGCVWDAFLMLPTSNKQQCRIAEAVAMYGSLDHLQVLRRHGVQFGRSDMQWGSMGWPPRGAAVGAGQGVQLGS